MFRDQKNKRNGWSLRDTAIDEPARLDRLLLILALAYLLVCGIGVLGQQQCRPAMWCTNKRSNELSVFSIGLVLLHVARLPLSAHAAFNAILHASESIAPNWG